LVCPVFSAPKGESLVKTVDFFFFPWCVPVDLVSVKFWFPFSYLDTQLTHLFPLNHQFTKLLPGQLLLGWSPLSGIFFILFSVLSLSQKDPEFFFPLHASNFDCFMFPSHLEFSFLCCRFSLKECCCVFPLFPQLKSPPAAGLAL